MKTTKPIIPMLSLLLCAGLAHAATGPAEVAELRAKNQQLEQKIQQQAVEIAALKAQLEKTAPDKAHPALPGSTKSGLSINKMFDTIEITKKEGEAFQGTYIELFSTRFNDTEARNLAFFFEKRGSKVVREDHFDPYSADRTTQLYKTEIRYETESARCLATCTLIQRILKERYGLDDVPIIHDSQYTYKGTRRYVEVYICDELSGQKYEFEGQKLPLRFW